MTTNVIHQVESVGTAPKRIELLHRLDTIHPSLLKEVQPTKDVYVSHLPPVANGYFESSIFQSPYLLNLLHRSPGSIIPFVFNKLLLQVVKANPSLINLLLSRGNAAFRHTSSIAILEELISNPKLFAALRSNSNLQVARKMLAGYMPDNHYLLSAKVNKEHLLLTKKLFNEKIFSERKLNTDNLIVRAWQTKVNADVAREKILKAANYAKAKISPKLQKELSTQNLLYGHSIEDDVVAKALKHHYEQIVRDPNSLKVPNKNLKSSLPPILTKQFYDSSKYPNINPVYLALAGSGGMITTKGRKVTDEEDPYTEEHPYKENFDKHNEVHEVVEVILSKLYSGTY